MRSKYACMVVDLRSGEDVVHVPGLIAVLSAAGWKTGVASKKYEGEALKLAKKVAKEGCSLVIGYGGDGTSNDVVRRHYRMMHLEEALEELYTPTGTEGLVRDRRTSLVLSFDDGNRDNYTHAFVLARELRVPDTIFLVPGYVGSGYPFPWQEGKRLATRTKVGKIAFEGRTYRLDYLAERNLLARAIDFRPRRAKSVAEREAFLTGVRKTLAVPPSVTVEEESMLHYLLPSERVDRVHKRCRRR